MYVFISGGKDDVLSETDGDDGEEEDEQGMPLTNLDRSELIQSYAGFCIKTVLYGEKIFNDDCDKLSSKLKAMRKKLLQ